MIDTLLNVLFVLIAIAMIVLILLQRGAGAQAGSGFGAGASGTVFGARGSANFLSQATKYLAIAFFSLTLFMAWQASHRAKGVPAKADLGVMAELPAAGADKAANPAPSLLPSATTPAPAALPSAAPSAAPSGTLIAPAPGTQPAPPVPQDAAPAPAEDSKGG